MEKFSGYYWPQAADGYYHRIESFVAAERAVEAARHLTELSPARVIITDGDDYACFEWTRDAGVTFPRETAGPQITARPGSKRYERLGCA
jgi:hypothetical protein